MSKRPGHRITRANKGHPRRQARRDRAAERLAAHVCGPTCKRNREWVVGERGPEIYVPTAPGLVL